jgi:hypothetical protein
MSGWYSAVIERDAPDRGTTRATDRTEEFGIVGERVEVSYIPR